MFARGTKKIRFFLLSMNNVLRSRHCKQADFKYYSHAIPTEHCLTESHCPKTKPFTLIKMDQSENSRSFDPKSLHHCLLIPLRHLLFLCWTQPIPSFRFSPSLESSFASYLFHGISRRGTLGHVTLCFGLL